MLQISDWLKNKSTQTGLPRPRNYKILAQLKYSRLELILTGIPFLWCRKLMLQISDWLKNKSTQTGLPRLRNHKILAQLEYSRLQLILTGIPFVGCLNLLTRISLINVLWPCCDCTNVYLADIAWWNPLQYIEIIAITWPLHKGHRHVSLLSDQEYT